MRKDHIRFLKKEYAFPSEINFFWLVQRSHSSIASFYFNSKVSRPRALAARRIDQPSTKKFTKNPESLTNFFLATCSGDSAGRATTVCYPPNQPRVFSARSEPRPPQKQVLKYALSIREAGLADCSPAYGILEAAFQRCRLPQLNQWRSPQVTVSPNLS